MPTRTPVDPEALFAEARRRRRNRRLRFSLLGLLAAGAGAGFYGAFGTGPPAMPTVSQIRRAVAAELARSNDLVLDVTTVHPVNRFQWRAQTWVDLKTRTSRSSTFTFNGGTKLTSTLTSFRPERRRATVAVLNSTHVDYRNRAWLKSTSFEPLRIATESLYASNPLAIPGLRFTLVGTETINGEPSFHLRAVYPPPLPALESPLARLVPTTLDVWIARSSYRVIREQHSNSRGIIGTTDFRWLPRTPATLAQLELVVPRGYSGGYENTP